MIGEIISLETAKKLQEYEKLKETVYKQKNIIKDYMLTIEIYKRRVEELEKKLKEEQ